MVFFFSSIRNLSHRYAGAAIWWVFVNRCPKQGGYRSANYALGRKIPFLDTNLYIRSSYMQLWRRNINGNLFQTEPNVPVFVSRECNYEKGNFFGCLEGCIGVWCDV